MKSSMDKCNWKDINYPSGKDDWKKFEKNNPTVVLNKLYAKKRKNIPSLYFKTQLKA